MPPRRSRFNPVALGAGPPAQPQPVTPQIIRPPRRPWEQLSPGTRKRYASYYRRTYGYDEPTVALEYNRGTLGPLTAARGHTRTPERRIEREQATPEQLQRYGQYFRRVPIIAYTDATHTQTQVFYEYRGQMPKPDRDRAWAHYSLVRDFIENRTWRSGRPGITPAFALQRWSVAPIEQRIVRNRRGTVYELSFDYDQIENLALVGQLDPYEISQQTGSQIVIPQEEAA